MTTSSPSRSPGFIAGQLYGNVGSFIQITGDPTVADTAFVDASDVRYADTLTAVRQGHDLGHRRQQYADRGRPLEYDALLWLAADLLDHRARAFGPPLTHIEDGYGQIVGGAGAYVFWNDMLYADLTFYKGLPGTYCTLSTTEFND